MAGLTQFMQHAKHRFAHKFLLFIFKEKTEI